MNIWDSVILPNVMRSGLRTVKRLSEETGIPYSTLLHERTSDPGTFRGYEIGSIIAATDMPDEDIAVWMREYAKRWEQ